MKSMDERWLLSRRALLGGVGALGLSSLLPRQRARAAAAFPTRFVVFHVPEGMWDGAARPTAGGSSLGPIFGPLDAHKDQMIFFNGLNMESRDRGPGGDEHHRAVPHMLTGTEMQNNDNAGGASLDQVIAKQIGQGTPLTSLSLAVRIVYADTNSKPIWSGPGRVVPAQQDPWQVYERVFSGSRGMVPSMPMGTTAPTAPAPSSPAPFDLRRSALDHALAESNALSSRLGASDRERLASYQESLRDIERRLNMLGNPSTGGTTTGGTTAPGASGTTCSQPMLGSEVNVGSESNYPKISQLQMDMLVAALQCDVTRVASFQYGNSNDQCSYSWLGVNNIGHDLAHNTGNCDPGGAKKTKVYNWYSEQFAYLLNKLKAVPEGSGTMLDNTVILWVSEFGESNGHSAENLMWMLMGNAAGYFKGGQVLNLGGRPTNDVLTTVQNAFGISGNTFGNPAYCQGPIDNARA
jgi:hypothetical protein